MSGRRRPSRSASLAHALALAALLTPSTGGSAAAQGVSASEYQRLRGGAPLTLEARAEGGAVRLAWTPPRRRAGEAIARFRVLRARAGGPFHAIGETAATAFLDRAPPRGRLTYAVAALSPGGAVVARSAAASVGPP